MHESKNDKNGGRVVARRDSSLFRTRIAASGVECSRHLRHTIISIQTAPRILADEYGRVLVRSTQIHRSDPRKQCGVLGRSGPVRLLRWTKTDGERERERRRPGEHGVSRDKPVMTEHAPMTRLANEGHPSGTIRTVTSASLTVLHSVPERLGRFVSEVCFFFFFYYGVRSSSCRRSNTILRSHLLIIQLRVIDLIWFNPAVEIGQNRCGALNKPGTRRKCTGTAVELHSDVFLPRVTEYDAGISASLRNV